MRRKSPKGHKVLIRYSNDRAWGRKGNRAYGRLIPSPEFNTWMKNTAGPAGVLWSTEKHPEGLEVYFRMPQHAMMAKLIWS